MLKRLFFSAWLLGFPLATVLWANSDLQRVDYRTVVAKASAEPLVRSTFVSMLKQAQGAGHWNAKAASVLHAYRLLPKKASSNQVMQLQKLIQSLGYEPGPIDGRFGPKTRQGLNRVRDRLIQNLLKAQGYDPGPLDGRFGPRTQKALRSFFEDRNENPGTRPTDEVLDRLIVLSSESRQ